MPSPTPSRTRRPIPAWLGLALLALPVAASLFLATTSSAGQPMQGVRAQHPLVFDEYMISFGPWPVSPQPVVQAPFRYRNCGSSPVRITQVQPSCGCLAPRLSTRVLEPGDVGEMLFSVRTANQTPGPHEYVVKLFYEDLGEDQQTGPQDVDVALKVVLPEKQVMVEPKALWFYQLGNSETTQSVTITDAREAAFEIRNITSSSDLVTARLAGTDTSVEGRTSWKLDITVSGDVPPGRHRGLVTLETTDPKYRAVQVPLMIQGPQASAADVAGQILVEPATLVLQRDEQGQYSAEGTIKLRNGQPLDGLDVAAEPGLVRATFERSDDGVSGILKVSAEAGAATSETRRAVVTVRTADPASNVTVPVLLRPANDPADSQSADDD